MFDAFGVDVKDEQLRRDVCSDATGSWQRLTTFRKKDTMYVPALSSVYACMHAPTLDETLTTCQ